MAKAAKKIVFSRSRDIPFNKLVLSASNVRRIRPDQDIDELAEDIARREDLVQGLNVRPVLDADGNETGTFEVPAGGRRYRAIERLVKAKRFPKDGLVPCIVRDPSTKILAEDDSLAENVHRVALHPLDQFRAFLDMREKRMSDEEIAVAFFTTVQVVKQRLRLASVSPKLCEVYADDGMTLEQLMAFTVTGDHARQEQVWDNVSRSGFDEPYQIRRMLTENTVRASDRRALFVGLEAYEQAGGPILRDLFEADDGGWLQDVPLLDRLVIEKLETEAGVIAAEGWKWISVAVDFPYAHDSGLRELEGTPADLTIEEQTTKDALNAEHDKLEAEYQDADELPDEVDQRLGEIEAALLAFEDRAMIYDPADVARAGVFISIDSEGRLSVDRGYVRAEDELPIAEPEAEQDGRVSAGHESSTPVQRTAITVAGASTAAAEDDEDDAVRPLPDRLIIELTAHRTLALRDALAEHPSIAFQAVLHNFVLATFYRFASSGSCLQIAMHTPTFPPQAPGLKESVPAKAIEARHEAWKARLPSEEKDLWDTLAALDGNAQAVLFAHCASFAVNALYEPVNRYNTGRVSAHGVAQRLEQAGLLARSVGLDMVQAGWKPTVDNYLGRVTKPRILEAVREAKGQASVQLIDHLKKADMAREAERLLDDAGWLPEPLRLTEVTASTPEQEEGRLPEFLADDEDKTDNEDEQPRSIAAE
jgi:ParB family transcriptional regulator, chromosome partitioning protein